MDHTLDDTNAFRELQERVNNLDNSNITRRLHKHLNLMALLYSSGDGSLPERLVESAVNELHHCLEQYFTEGLKRKGFEFTRKSDLIEFVKSNCRCEDYSNSREKIYYVRDTPFLLYRYAVETPELGNFEGSPEYKVSISLGRISFL